MSFSQTVNIARITIEEQEKDSFYLHIVTQCPSTIYSENGYTTEVNGELMGVTLSILEDSNVPFFPIQTPVVHSFIITEMPAQSGEGDIVINTLIVDNNGDPLASSGNPPTSTVNTTNADEDIRPIK